MYNFEIHITVQAINLEDFHNDCLDIGAKPIVIDLMNNDKQVMTSQTEKCKTIFEAYDLAKEYALYLSRNNPVHRIKIESCPKFIKETGFRTNEMYCEIHIPCHTELLEKFDFSQLKFKWHKSRNEFKDGVTFLTYRTFEDEEDVPKALYDISIFKENGLILDDAKLHWEYAVYDSRINLDDKWLKGK